MRAELKGLPAELADIVAAHLVAAGQNLDSDPALAYRHAKAARRRAARLPIVREATGEAAYAAGNYEAALAEFRALRRITGRTDFLPVMVDCLRALGKQREALILAEEGRAEIKDPDMQVELRIVEAGARADLGQTAEAGRLLRQLVERPPARATRPALARAWYAHAAALAAAGRLDAARAGFERAAGLDEAGETAALDRLDALDGFRLDIDEDVFDDFDEPGESAGSPEPDLGGPDEDGGGAELDFGGPDEDGNGAGPGIDALDEDDGGTESALDEPGESEGRLEPDTEDDDGTGTRPDEPGEGKTVGVLDLGPAEAGWAAAFADRKRAVSEAAAGDGVRTADGAPERGEG
jgi:tetratricopeptide (TPR) repeat protein